MPHETLQGSRLRAVLAIVSYCFIFAAVALHAAPTGTAVEGDANQIDPLSLLKSKRYAELERHYAARQQSYEAGAISEETVYGEFRELYEDAAGNERYFNGWVNAFPKSYSARMSRGTYFYRMGSYVRGTQFIAQTPRAQLAQMNQYLTKARADLKASLEMSKKPYLSALFMLNVANLSGTQEERRHWLDVGNALDPRNVLLRVRYMTTLQPRWGGSHREMREFLDECARQKLPKATLARLDLVIRRDIADALSDKATPAQRYEIWGEVRRAEQDAGAKPSVEALMRHTRAAWDLNNKDEANRGLEQLARMNVEEGWALTQMAWMYGLQGRHKEGWPLLLKAAKRRNPTAQFVVGKTMYEGSANLGVTADKKAGLGWIQRAAAQNHDGARAFLKTVNE